MLRSCEVLNYFIFQISSPHLCRVIEEQMASEDQACINVIKCFLNPKLMLNRPDSHNGGCHNAPRSGEKDPLLDFFFPHQDEKHDGILRKVTS